MESAEETKKVASAKTHEATTVSKPQPQNNDVFDDGGHWPINRNTSSHKNRGW